MKRYVGAGALITKQRGQVLLVQPTYKPTWEIPGGLVEESETPAQACERECKEEVGLVVAIGQLLVVDHQTLPGRGDSRMFVYDGGELSPQTAIQLRSEELASHRYVDVIEVESLAGGRIAARIKAALGARGSGRVAELDGGAARS